MSKRFTDTDKYKKPFIRYLNGAYKLFWDYLYHDCDHAGIWIVDFEIAQIYLGNDMQVNRDDALKYFNNGKKRVIEIDNRSKWFLPKFVEFQYGLLNPKNNAHNSVINILSKYKLVKNAQGAHKGLISIKYGAMDKDKDKDKDMEQDKDNNFFDDFWEVWPKKKGRQKAIEAFEKIKVDKEMIDLIVKSIEVQKKETDWTKDNGQFIPLPATWLNQKRWEDEINISGIKTQDDKKFDEILNGMD